MTRIMRSWWTIPLESDSEPGEGSRVESDSDDMTDDDVMDVDSD